MRKKRNNQINQFKTTKKWVINKKVRKKKVNLKVNNKVSSSKVKKRGQMLSIMTTNKINYSNHRKLHKKAKIPLKIKNRTIQSP